MDIRDIIKSQRQTILNKFGFDIQVEESQITDYKYTIKNGNFSVFAYRDTKDEIDTLYQVLKYLDSFEHKLAFTEANAYNYCYNVACPKYDEFYTAPIKRTFEAIEKKLSNAKKVDFEKELKEMGIENISSLHCTNVIGLENSRKTLNELYDNLVFVYTAASQQLVNYESTIELSKPEEESEPENK